jgi:hypothetical protein
VRWDDLTKDLQDALLSLERAPVSMLTVETVYQLKDLGLVEEELGGLLLTGDGRRVLLQRRDDGSA